MIALWMAYSILIAALVGATAALLEPFALARRVPTRGLWLGAIAVSMIVAIAVAIRPGPRTLLDTVGIVTATTTTPLQPTEPEPSVLPLDRILLWGWVLSSLFVGGGVVVAVWLLTRLRRRSKTSDMEGTCIAITQSVGPGAAPFGYPRIFVPAWATTLEQRAVRLLVMHEREHLRAGDPRWLLLATGVCVVMPWNVALWWCIRRLRCAMELDCDARVLAIDHDVQSYGELLLLVASHRSRPRLTALLTFAESSSPLERRIRTMTEHHTLGLFRAWTLGAAAAVAIVVACETPRPAPVAPTKTSSASESPAFATVPDEPSPEARRTKLKEGLSLMVPKEVLYSSTKDPLVVVLSPDGEVVRAVRLAGFTEGTKMPIGLMGVEPESISSVDVVKGAWLPPEVSGGVIYVKLKKAGDAEPERGALILKRDEKFPVIERKLSEAETGTITNQAPLVEVRDANNRVVYSKRLESAGRMMPEGKGFRDTPFSEDDIAKVEITKPAGIIRVWLKPGAKLLTAK